MAAPRKSDDETRARAVRMYQDRIGEGEPKATARQHVGALLDTNPATLRNWVDKRQTETGERPGPTQADSEELRRLRKENTELRRANEILKTASAFSPRRSSTATSSDRRRPRHLPRSVQGRADLPGADRSQHPDRPSTYDATLARGASEADLADAANALLDLFRPTAESTGCASCGTGCAEPAGTSAATRPRV